MDDGSKVVVAFRTREPGKTGDPEDSPNLNILITPANGQTMQDFLYAPVNESEIGKDRCFLKFGPHRAEGDFRSYDIHIEPVNGIGAHLHYEALVEPFRQGTAIIAMGEQEELYHTDLSVPKSMVTGTLTYDGEEHAVSGFGYHDHQWMNVNVMTAYHHWFWGRLYTDEYSVIIYDFVGSEKYDFKKIPFFGVEDRDGHVIFTTNGNFKKETTLEIQKDTGKAFPKNSSYVFDNGDMKVQFDISWTQLLEVRDMYGSCGEEQRRAYHAAGVQPVYIRCAADGSLTIIKDGNEEHSSGNMIYEYAYFGKQDVRAEV